MDIDLGRVFPVLRDLMEKCGVDKTKSAPSALAARAWRLLLDKDMRPARKHPLERRALRDMTREWDRNGKMERSSTAPELADDGDVGILLPG
jgi:hypothetical protein